MHKSIHKWRPGASLPAPTANPNLRIIVNALIILAIIIAVSCGGLTEAMVGLLLSRLL